MIQFVIFLSTFIRVWHREEWYFSVVDVVRALTESINLKDYWFKLKMREVEPSQIELSTFCRQLKLPSSDGKFYETDCAGTQNMFRYRPISTKTLNSITSNTSI